MPDTNSNYDCPLEGEELVSVTAMVARNDVVAESMLLARGKQGALNEASSHCSN